MGKKYDSFLEKLTYMQLFRKNKKDILVHPEICSIATFSTEDLEKAYEEAVKSFLNARGGHLAAEVPELSSFCLERWKLDYVISKGSALIHVDVRDDYTHDYTEDMELDAKKRKQRHAVILRDYMKEILLRNYGIRTMVVHDAQEAKTINYRLRYT